LVLEKKINIPKERAYPEYQFKPKHACVNLEKMKLYVKHIRACFRNLLI